MDRLLNVITPLHTSTKRDFIARMTDDKVACMVKARAFEFDYWDGDRRFGYGGYRYIPGRWTAMAESLIQIYKLKSGSKVLDIGCGKAFLLFELTKLVPGIVICGCDISEHALATAPEEVRPFIFRQRAQDPFLFGDREFDLVLSVNTLHNLRLPELAGALSEIVRISKESYIVVESYRSPQELFNLQCWALTAEAFFDPETWKWVFSRFGYQGDYEFIYF
jgi:ubiquinone/menaquinone biosynthesis C-methylase UbiE